MAVTKTDPTFEGKRITLLDGTKERIVKVMKTGYKTEGGTKIKPSNIGKKGRGLIELDGDGSGATPKTGSTTRKRGSNSKQSAKGNSDVAKQSTSKTKSADMGRRELVSALVDAEVFRVRADAKGVGIDELREMVDNIGKKGKKSSSKSSGKSAGTGKSSGKSSRSKKKNDDEQEEAKPKRQRRGKKASNDDSGEKANKVPRRGKKDTAKSDKGETKKTSKKSASTKPKPVKSITSELARSVEAALGEHVADFIRKSTGHNFTVACVGGVFNDERLTMQIGLLPTNASDEDIEAYAADMEDAEQKATSDSSSGGQAASELDMLRKFIDEESADDTRLQRAIDGWNENFDEVIEPKLGDEVSIGTKLDYEDEEAIVVGYSDKKGKIVLFLTESGSMKLVSIAKVVRMEIIEDEAPEAGESDGEDDDFDAEDDEDEGDEEDDDLEDTEDEDDDLEDTDEDDEEEDDDAEEDDEEEDFDDEEDDDSEEEDDDDSEEDDDDSEEDDDDDDFDDFDDEL